jgi:hypothetical protein
MQRHRPKPVRSRSILHRRIRHEVEDDDSVWDDAILVLGGDDKPAASGSGS